MPFLARVAGLLALAGAFAAALFDGARFLADEAWTPASTGAALDWLSPGALAAARVFVERRLGAWAWNGLVAKALTAPAFAALTAAGTLLFLLSRPPETGRSSRNR